jgi:imidazoleglycerol phosphate synthase glutamine amidotransferase subunit HisH
MGDSARVRVAFASTGVANLASIEAVFRRAGAEPFVAGSPDELAAAAFAVVPGVGSFGSAIAALRAAGMDAAVQDRITRKVPTMGVCAGMQVFFEASEESPGASGLGLLPGTFRRFGSGLPVPQLGWNMVDPGERSSTADIQDTLIRAERSSAAGKPNGTQGLVRRGWAYYANSYRLSEAPAGPLASWSVYGEAFVAALERPGLLLCQFHPELSGPWGLGLIRAWLEEGEAREGASL